MRLENSKNYSPLESIKVAKLAQANAKNGAAEEGMRNLTGRANGEYSGAGEEKPVKEFRERLVDFLMYVLCFFYRSCLETMSTNR